MMLSRAARNASKAQTRMFSLSPGTTITKVEQISPAVSTKLHNDSILEICVDTPNEKMNTLDQNIMSAFETVLNKVENDPSIKAAVITSNKPGCFFAGADIKMFGQCKNEAELTALSANGSKLMNRLANQKIPVVAAIDGVCLGGGLEVALACKYRVATSSPKTKLGLPEVMLGLLPGAGGTQRLPKLIGIQQSLTMMTTGSNIKPAKALKMGLVDEVVDPSNLSNAAINAAIELANGKLKPKVRKVGLLEKLLEQNPIGRNVLFSKAKETVDKKSGGHYPAIYKILDVIRVGAESGFDAGLKAEAEAFGTLGMGNVSKALRGIYFAQNATKKTEYGSPQKKVEVVGVLGAGLMGAGIAQVTSQIAKLPVVLKDRNRPAVTRGIDGIEKDLATKVKQRKMNQVEAAQVTSRIIGVSDEDPVWSKHMAKADLIVEAVFEDLQVKHKVIQSLEPYMKPDTVFATNTSAIPIAKIAAGAKRPENVVGMHYFSPVPKMPLLEIIPHAGSSKESVARAIDLGQRQGKTCIVVKDVPGFYVNRCLIPYMAEGIALVQGGVDPVRVDKALKKFGFPVGPISLADEVGVDVAYHTYLTMKPVLGERMEKSSDAGLKIMVDKKILGRKTGKGFFLYDPKQKKGEKPLNPEVMEILKGLGEPSVGNVTDEEIVERMNFRFIIEVLHSIQAGIVDVNGANIGAVFGLGYPPFTGGPLRFVDTYGAQKLVDRLNYYVNKVGKEFTPPQNLIDMAKSGGKFCQD